MDLLTGYLVLSIPLVLFALIAWTYDALRQRKLVGPVEGLYLQTVAPVAAIASEVGTTVSRLSLALAYLVGFFGTWLLGLYLLVRFVKWAWVG